jgi:hypothetical protein
MTSLRAPSQQSMASAASQATLLAKKSTKFAGAVQPVRARRIGQAEKQGGLVPQPSLAAMPGIGASLLQSDATQSPKARRRAAAQVRYCEPRRVSDMANGSVFVRLPHPKPSMPFTKRRRRKAPSPP